MKIFAGISMLGKNGFQSVHYVIRENPTKWLLRDEHGQTIVKFYGTATEVINNLRTLENVIANIENGVKISENYRKSVTSNT